MVDALDAVAAGPEDEEDVEEEVVVAELDEVIIPEVEDNVAEVVEMEEAEL